MSDLKPDERPCPYCAETIKTAAVKCRWCGSELEAGTTDPTMPVQAQDSREPTVSPRGRWLGRRPRSDEIVPTSANRGDEVPRWGRSTLPLLVVLLLISIAAVTFAVRRANADETAPDGTITSESARAVAMQRLADSTAKVLSYKAETFDADAEASGKLMTRKMRAQYLDALRPAKADAVKNGITLKATVVETSLIKQTARSVRGLLFVNQVTTSTGTTNQQLDSNRVVVTMQKSGDRWLISKMDAF